jgi:4'-phosphopantetheinyl transferase EntD
MLEGLLPDDVKTAWGDPREDAPLGLPAEEALIARAVEKRKREFRKARACARGLLEHFGVRDFALLSGEQREPLWPEGLVGSVTHTDGLCAVVVGSGARYAGLGIDVEPAQPLESGIAKRVCVQGEFERASAATKLEPFVAARLVFSAKEAFYKCQFVSTRRFLGFSDVSVSFAPSGEFAVHMLTEVSELGEASAFSGRWAVRGGFVLTSSFVGRRLGAP